MNNEDQKPITMKRIDLINYMIRSKGGEQRNTTGS